MTKDAAPWPTEVRLWRKLQRLQIDFDDGQSFDLPAALLRAMTPSAADRGHTGTSEHPLAVDFRHIGLIDAVPIGAYAVRLVFDDGHDTGIYTWSALYALGRNKDSLTAEYTRLISRP